MIVDLFLIVLGTYATIGLLFGLYFLLLGASRIDPLMKDTSKGVRALLFPGVVATWPFLINKLKKHINEANSA